MGPMKEIQASVKDIVIPDHGDDLGNLIALEELGEQVPFEIAARYCREITNPAITLPMAVDCNRKLANVWHVFPVRTERRDEFQVHLTEKGVQTVIHYPIPPHRQPAYTEWHDLALPITEKIHDTIISLPISPVMTDDEVAEVIAAVNRF